jgi:hypothetical protein
MTEKFLTPRGHMANLIACAQSDDPLDAEGMCPLRRQTLQLLPVRYGLVEDLDPSIEIQMPYKLQSHPLGFRLLRDGYLYVIDSASGHLHEYRTENGSVSSLLFKGREVRGFPRTQVLETDPALIFSRRSALHVCLSEVQWTAVKCAQVLNVAAERDHFMQRVSFEGVDSGNGRDLIEDTQMAVWLAESSGAWADKPAAESNQIPYAWEHAPLYRQTILEEFTSQVDAAHKRDFLFLAVRDDVGVMRDLAAHQNRIVGELENWATAGVVERDYLLGCYIESLTQINDALLAERAASDPALKALLDDLEALPEPERGETRRTLLEVANEDSTLRDIPDINSLKLPDDLRTRINKIPANVEPYSVHAGQTERNYVLQQYYLEQRFAETNPDFIARHRQPLWQLYSQMEPGIKDLLYGAKFGQRGINELIDRPRMDAFLKQQRAILQPLNEQLEKITQDRVDLLISHRLHRALWYYDIDDSDQVDHALLTEYACLSDICRSDSATQQVLDRLNQRPTMIQPMFYALPLSLQTELGVQFAVFTNAGWALLKNTPDWLERLQQWGAGKVLNNERLSPATQVNVNAAWGTLAPALNMGIQQAVQAFMQQMDKGQLPDMDTLFRSLPKAAGVAILEAARQEQVVFQVASAEDLEQLGKTVSAVHKERKTLSQLTNYTRERRVADRSWHLSEDARLVKGLRLESQLKLDELEQQLARAMSPLAELQGETTHLQAPSPGKPGLALVFPAKQHAEVRSVLENYRRGVTVAPKAGLLGDGAGLLVFLAQVVNLVQIKKEIDLQPNAAKNWTPLWGAAAATAAAGLGAAQGIADTALSAHAAELAKNLKKAELLGVHVQMGKLHIGLGLGGYLAGVAAAAISLNSSLSNWQEAVRSGNSQAQAGAAITIAGNTGFLISNSYGIVQTGSAFSHVLATARKSPQRLAAWAAAGTRLSTVFLRFNLAGILCTALELAGSWYYNRHNLSRLDRWMQSTPWGLDPERRLSRTLKEYQKDLRGDVQAPRLQVMPSDDKNPRQYLLHFPTLSASDVTESLGSNLSNVLLNIGGYQVIRVEQVRVRTPERWTPLKQGLDDRLSIVNEAPLTLRLNDVRGLITSSPPEYCDIVLSIQLGHQTAEGMCEANIYHLRFPLYAQEGDFPTERLEPKGEQCPYFAVDPACMPVGLD